MNYTLTRKKFPKPLLENLPQTRANAGGEQGEVAMEKIRPIEHKLKYQVDKCVGVAETGHIDSDDPSRFKLNPEQHASKFGDDDGDSSDNEDDDEEANADKSNKKYVAPMNVPAYFERDKTQEEIESEQMAKKKTALSHSMMRELQQQLYDTPEEISHGEDRVTANISCSEMDMKLEPSELLEHRLGAS